MNEPLRVCTHGGCRKLVRGGGRCEKHRKERNQQSTKNRSGDPFYSSAAWKRIRDARRSANPLCQLCESVGITKAMHAVDHIIPRRERPELELEYDNTQSLCERCHNRKSMKELRAMHG